MKFLIWLMEKTFFFSKKERKNIFSSQICGIETLDFVNRISKNEKQFISL